MFLLERGAVKLERVCPNGTRLLLSLRHSPSVLGAPAAALRSNHLTTGVAVDKVQAATLPMVSFQQQMQGRPELSAAISYFVALELKEHLKDLERVCSLTVRQRLECFLKATLKQELSSPRTHEASVEIRLPIAMQELAQMLHTSPETLSRALGQMKREGLIQNKRKGSLIVPNPARWLTKSRF